MLEACFKASPAPAPECLLHYMTTAYSLGYEDRPDYTHLKSLFLRELAAGGWRDDAGGLDWLEPSVAATGPQRRTSPRRKPRAQQSKAVEEEGKGEPAKKRRLERPKQDSTNRVKKQRGEKQEEEEECVNHHSVELDSPAAGEAGEREEESQQKGRPPAARGRKRGGREVGSDMLPDVTYPSQLGYGRETSKAQVSGGWGLEEASLTAPPHAGGSC